MHYLYYHCVEVSIDGIALSIACLAAAAGSAVREAELCEEPCRLDDSLQ